jgi:hypothetical protein
MQLYLVKMTTWRVVVFRAVLLLATLASSVYSSAMAEDKLNDKIDELRTQGYSVSVVSPIFGQLVMFSFPKGFKTVVQNTSLDGNRYIRSAVPDGETGTQWSQMITVTGAKGLAANQNLSAQVFVEEIAGVFQRACPFTFLAKRIGATKISGQDAYVMLAGCGTAPSNVDKHSETALLIAIKGSADYYTIQWAERATPSNQPMVPNEAIWTERMKKLSPIKICALVLGEAAPYPSCVNQK